MDKEENWAKKTDSDVYEQVEKFYTQIQKAFENRTEADDAIEEYWHIANAEPDENQIYVGNSKCYIPAVKDVISARTKRALAQLFPSKYKHVEAVGSDGQKPSPQLALLEHYIRSTRLKSICRSVLFAGDVTGQWNLYVDWKKTYRTVTDLMRRNPQPEGMEVELPMEEPEESLEDDEIMTEGPLVVDFATEDLVVIPPTVTSIADAHITAIKLRMSKDEVKRLIDDGTFVLEDPESELSDWVADHKGDEKRVPSKKRTSDAGIRTEGTLQYALIFEAHAYLEFEKGKKSLAYIYFAGEKEILGIIKAPQWGQRRPILSAPVDRVSGSFNGISKIEAVKYLQWNLNDFWNMGQDSAMYSLLPIVMTDPEKNPNYAMMVYGLAAVWPVDPNSTKMQSFPALWKDSVMLCDSIERRIWVGLEATDLMMGRTPPGRKNNQMVGAQMAEQSIPIMDHAERFEEEILSPLMELFFEYDAQFREDEVTVVTLGEIGVRAMMQKIPPQQWGERYFFQWTGTSYMRSLQQMQQQIATMNVLRGIPPQQLNGRKLDVAPILEMFVENVFGAELGNKILIDDRNKFTIPANVEDEMMINGIPAEVHEIDNDVEHMQQHQQAGQMSGDPMGLIRNHMQAHAQQLQKKRQMAMAAMQPQPGQPGVPGGAGPGVAGSPRHGAQPMPQRPVQNPPGAIQQDNMPGAPGRG